MEKGEISARRSAQDRDINPKGRPQAADRIEARKPTMAIRRSWWHFDFLAKLTGCELFHRRRHRFAGVQTRHDAVRVIGKIDFPLIIRCSTISNSSRRVRSRARHAEDDDTLARGTAFPGGRRSISKQIYPDVDLFYEDLAKTYRKAVKAFYDAGCRYLQFERHRVGLSLLRGRTEEGTRSRRIPMACRKSTHASSTTQSPSVRPTLTITTVSAAAISARPGFPPGATSRWPKPCWPAPIMTAISSKYDSERAGGSSHCGFCRMGNNRGGRRHYLQERRTREKGRYQAAAGGSAIAPLDQLAVSPQCVPRPKRATSSPRTSSGPS